MHNIFEMPYVKPDAQHFRDESDVNPDADDGEILTHQDSTIEPDAVVFPLQLFQDYLDRIEFSVKATRLAGSFWGYLAFLLILIMVVVFEGGATSAFEFNNLANSYARTKGSFNPNSPGYQHIQTVADWWDWLQLDMLPQYNRQNWYNLQDGTPVNLTADDTLGRIQMARYNLIVGSLRFVQKRVTTDSCSIPSSTYRLGARCFAYFNSDNEDESSSAYLDNSMTIPWLSRVPGMYNQYDGSGIVVDLLPNQTTEEWTAIVNTLKADLWINQNTRMVQMVINTVNPGMGMWMSTNLNFEFSPSGVIYKDITVRSFSLRYPIVSVLLLAFLGWGSLHYLMGAMFFTVKEALDRAAFIEWWRKWRKHSSQQESTPPKELSQCSIMLKQARLRFSCIFKCWTRWRTIDVCQAVCMVWWLYNTSNFLHEIYRFNPDMLSTEFLDLSKITISRNTSTLLQGPMFFLVVLKSIRYMQMNSFLSVISDTIFIGAADMGYFGVSFLCLYVAFLFWSHATFTGLVPELSTPVHAINTNVEYFMGIIDVNSLYEADRWIGPLFAILYIVVMTLAMCNVYIGIINVAYEEATKLQNRPQPFRDAKTSISRVEFFNAALSFLAYIEKIFLVISLNMCCTTCRGLAVEQEEWDEMRWAHRLKLVFSSTLVWLFKLVFLFQLTPVSEKNPSDVVKIYTNHVVLSAVVEKFLKKATVEHEESDSSQEYSVGITYEAVRSIVGNMDSFVEEAQLWNGPAEGRLEKASEEYTIQTCFEELAHAAKCITVAQCTSDPARPKQVYKTGSPEKTSKYQLLRSQRQDDLSTMPARIEWVMTVHDFPESVRIRNVTFDVTCTSRDVPKADIFGCDNANQGQDQN